MKKNIIFGILFLLIILLPNKTQASTLSCSQVDGLSIFGYNGSKWVHIGAIGNKINSLSIANEIGAGSEIKSTSIMNNIGKYGSEISSQSAFNKIASNPPIIVNNSYKFLGYVTTNEYKNPNINTYEAIACARNSFKSPNKNMEDITFKNIPENDQIQSQLRTVTNAITGAYADELNYNKTLNDFYESRAQDLNKRIEMLTAQEQALQNSQITDLETKIRNTQSLIDNYCINTYGVNSITLSPGKCTCNTGYVLGKGNKCISISSWCSELSNTYMKNGTCECLDGYSYDNTLKTCKLIEIKKEIVQRVVVQKEPVKNIPNKTITVTKSPILLDKPVDSSKEHPNDTITKEETITPINPEPVKKIKWYQKIFNWFK